MPIFKSFWRIIKKNKGALFLGLLINVGVSFFFAQNINEQNATFSTEQTQIAVFNRDDGEIANNLEKYLNSTMKPVTLKNQQSAIDDALYFNKVEYVIVIPKGFSKMIEAGKIEKLAIQTNPKTYSAAFMNNYVNNYLTTYQHYLTLFPEKSAEEITELTSEAVSIKGKVDYDVNYTKLQNIKIVGRLFSLLAYGLFAVIFSGIAVTSLVFNKKEIQRRNSCSPYSKRKITKQFFIAAASYTACAFVIFISYIIVLVGFEWNQYYLYFLLNSFIFLLAIVSLSVFLSQIITNEDMISGLNNILILGSCFLGGVFIQQSYLPDFVQKISSFTPTYWFVRSNDLIGSTVNFNGNFSSDFKFNSLILLAFSVVFLLLTLVTRRETGGLKLLTKKTAETI